MPKKPFKSPRRYVADTIRTAPRPEILDLDITREGFGIAEPSATRTRDVKVPRGMPNFGGPEMPVTKRLRKPQMAPTGRVRLGRKKGSKERYI